MLYCPRCGTRHPVGDVCPDCHGPLVPENLADTPEDSAELVAVARISDSTLLPLVRSVLDAAGIPYLVQGEEALGLFPLGPFGGGVFNRVLGASVLVPSARAEEARELLRLESIPDETD